MALVKEPVLHFLLIGAVLFTAFGLQQEKSSDETTNRILLNVGVEPGQLMFVAVILLLIAILRRISQQWPFWIRQLPAYGIGGLSAFWVIERVSGIYPHFSPPFSAIAPALLYLLRPCSRTAATQWLTLPDFHSVRALNIV